MVGRRLGLDVGHKTIGVAWSDPLGVTAQPSHVWRRRGIAEDVAHIAALCRQEDVREIVIGQPRRTDGTLGPEAKKIDAFARAVKEGTGVPVVLWDERFTTKMAERSLIDAGLSRRKRRGVIDQIAAAFILQSYMRRKGDAP